MLIGDNESPGRINPWTIGGPYLEDARVIFCQVTLPHLTGGSIYVLSAVRFATGRWIQETADSAPLYDRRMAYDVHSSVLLFNGPG